MKKIFVILLFALLSLNVYLISTKKSTIKIRNIIKENVVIKTYTEYKIGDTIDINEEPWYVISNSNKEQDYVTLINLNYNRTIKDCYTKYDNLNEKKYFEGEYLNSLNVKTKEVDGYKIRLIKLEEYENLVDLTKKDIKDNTYNYKVKYKYGWVKDINTLSMNEVYFHYELENSCICWYIWSNMKEVTSLKEGYVNIQPVINMLKEEI